MKLIAPPALPFEMTPARGRVLSLTRQSGRDLPYFLYAPASAGPGAELFVSVHGLARNAVSHVMRFRKYAERAGAVLIAPFFSKDQHRLFQRLAPGAGGRRPDAALNAAIEEVERMLKRPPAPAYFFGYSGGGQFVHRYAMRHPARVKSAVLAAPGWFTFPNPETPFPHGLAPSSGEADIDIDRFLTIPLSVVVGEEDVERDGALNKSEIIDKAQGRNRLERATNWVAAMGEAGARRGLAPNVTLILLRRAGHGFEQNMDKRGLGEAVFRELFARPSRAARPPLAAPSRERRDL